MTAPLQDSPFGPLTPPTPPPVEATPAQEQNADNPELEDELSDSELLTILLDYYYTAKEAREAGVSARDEQWRLNVEAYWARRDSSDKEAWQADEELPEVQNSVDRFSAQLRELLIQPDWYDVIIPGDNANLLVDHVRKFLDIQLERCGRNPTSGQPIGFNYTFGTAAKSGALMAMALQVRVDEERRVVVEPIDPRQLYYDPTGRNLFRVRRYEVDFHDLLELAEDEDSPWDLEAVQRLKNTPGKDEEGAQDRREISGSEQPDSTSRKPVTLLEFRCDVVNREGEVVRRNQHITVANEREIVLSQDNPFLHGLDWITFAPVITVPFSVYGRSYVEGFRRIVDTFTANTNMVLDATFIASMKTFILWANALEDPTQAESIHPMKVFVGSDEAPIGTDFLKSIDLGSVNPSVVQVWQALRQLLRDYSQQNELSLGQLPPKGDITATEITQVSQGQSALARTIARDVEDLLLSPVLTQVWAVALQFLDENDTQMAADIGQETFAMLVAQKQEFLKKSVHFKARGISEVVERNQRVRTLLSALQVIGSNELLLKAFLQDYSVQRVVNQLFADMGLDLTRAKMTPQEKVQQQTLAQTQPPGASGGSTTQGSPPKAGVSEGIG